MGSSKARQPVIKVESRSDGVRQQSTIEMSEVRNGERTLCKNLLVEFLPNTVVEGVVGGDQEPIVVIPEMNVPHEYALTVAPHRFWLHYSSSHCCGPFDMLLMAELQTDVTAAAIQESVFLKKVPYTLQGKVVVMHWEAVKYCAHTRLLTCETKLTPLNRW